MNKARSEMGLAFISFHMPKGVGRPILALVSYFEQFYPLPSGLAGKQIGRVQYFLNKEEKELMDCGESLVLKGKISKLSYPGTILINNSVENYRTEMRPWQITYGI